MAARRDLPDDLSEIGSRLSWRACLVAAAGTGLGLHLLAIGLAAPATVTSTAGLGTFAARNLIGTFARLMQFVVPLALLIGALVGYLRRAQTRTLFGAAKASGADALAKMSWGQFERLIGEVFRREGFAVHEQGGPNPDGGVDLVISKEGKRYLVQCKHWKVQRVGVAVVRELNGVVAAQKAAGGYVVTSGIFTQEARAFAKACPIELIDGRRIGSLIRGAIQSSTVEEGTTSPVALDCPKCGSAMVRRVAKQGTHAGQSFWGCSRYPECRGFKPSGAQ